MLGKKLESVSAVSKSDSYLLYIKYLLVSVM